MTKKKLREKSFFLRQLIKDKNVKEKKIIENLKSIIPTNNEIISGYYPVNSEVNILPFLKFLIKKDLVICLPFIFKANSHLLFKKFKLETRLIDGKYKIKVPDNDNHVMYVWIDALCNYITALNYPDTENDSFKKFWPGVHVVGKDILRFHAVYWPAFLMAADIEPPKKIFAHGWWTNEGQKISKSIGNIINPYEIIEKYGLDQIRYFLFREVPFGNDGDFSKDAIAQRVNADLSNNYGNLIQRISSFIVKNTNSKVYKPTKFNEDDKKLFNSYDKTFKNYLKHMNTFQIDRALKNIFDNLSEVNAYVDNQAPWSLKNTNPDRMKDVLYLLTCITIKCSVLLFPVIPSSIKKILSIYNLSINDFNLNKINQFLPDHISLNQPHPIFPRIEL